MCGDEISGVELLFEKAEKSESSQTTMICVQRGDHACIFLHPMVLLLLKIGAVEDEEVDLYD